MSKSTVSAPTRNAELTPKAAKVVDRVKAQTKIPMKHLIEEAIINYLPSKYEGGNKTKPGLKRR